ncbi:MAG: extracellular solute-binding protein, partial [Chitinivibrionales bacterium]|nr:extracellular solute-binding protein [Chitinivibrionales bacterium]
FIDGKLYYLPRKLETRILFYRKSKVADAIVEYPAHKERIDRELKVRNGYGLPAGYEFESDPAEWDFYDLYVVGSIWANKEYNGVKMGRLAHRGARYGGTALFLVDRALQLGATDKDILELTTDKTAEMFLWENVLAQSGAYNPGMWEDPWKGANIYNGIKDGKVFLAYLQQIDCFLVHGWEDDPGMPTYLPEPGDMGLAVVPKAVSFALNDEGRPLYEGTRSISTGGWWWGIPKTCPNKELAYKLARYITSKEVQAEESAKFGMLPVRKDILNNLAQVFDEGWVGEIFRISVDQINTQLDRDELVTVPLVPQYSQVGRNLVDAWYKLAVEYDEEAEGKADLGIMKAKLAEDFLVKQQGILGERYPE